MDKKPYIWKIGDKPFGIIYRAINKVNGKIYIGQTYLILSKRKQIHRDAMLNPKKNTYFCYALRKYSMDGFDWEEIDSADSEEELDYLEKYWIKFYDTRNKKKGYNLAEGGGVNRGFKWSDKTRKLRQDRLIDVSRPIRCIETGEIFSSLIDVGKKFNQKTRPTNLYRVLNGHAFTFLNLRWEWADCKNENKHISPTPGIKKPVRNLATGVEYPSCQNAGKASGIKPRKIRIFAKNNQGWTFISNK